MSRHVLRAGFLGLGLVLAGCGGAARPEGGQVSPADRAVGPGSASGHATDGPTGTRTGAQRPAEQTAGGEAGDER